MTTHVEPHAKNQTRARLSPGPGAKLLCVDDVGLKRRYTPGSPVRGRVYCVREVYDLDTAPGVLLAGIRGPINPLGLECGFLLARFIWLHE